MLPRAAIQPFQPGGVFGPPAPCRECLGGSPYYAGGYDGYGGGYGGYGDYYANYGDDYRQPDMPPLPLHDVLEQQYYVSERISPLFGYDDYGGDFARSSGGLGPFYGMDALEDASDLGSARGALQPEELIIADDYDLSDIADIAGNFDLSLFNDDGLRSNVQWFMTDTSAQRDGDSSD